ncbi:MAG: hypothetical protein ABS43_18335 [Bordetella sp. SCN 67-23]|nr:hypothetical protein [Burkholderiales bacterium]ODS72238.1 MAG: hypothetical protein ABS43_18335 [Bordetella sp. SCN 67-23]OJW93494.1 MAG: hypothetical protein BGO71_16120 [Burkholderiales bacterium 67-32]
MPSIFQSAYIPELNARLDTVAQLPKRESIVERALPPDFPQGAMSPAVSALRARRGAFQARLQAELGARSGLVEPDVMIVGAGWYFLQTAIALAAAGASMVAYEMNLNKIGKGQIGLTGQDDYFALGEHREAQLMPDFTSEQLDRLPPVIRALAQMPSYQALARKREIADAIFTARGEWRVLCDRYASLPPEQRISKREVIEMKQAALAVLQEHGVLKIIPTAADIEAVSARLDKGRAVLMASGRQVNLEKMGLAHLRECPGFVPELLRGEPETEAAIAAILERQQQVARWASETDTAIGDIPIARLPKVAIIGGGASARGNALDLIQRTDPGLLNVVSVRPLPKVSSVASDSVDAARKKMDFHLYRGYVSRLSRSPDGSAISGIQVMNAEDRGLVDIPVDLFVHTADESLPVSGESMPYKDAADAATNELREQPARNGFIRNQAIVAVRDLPDIELRIVEPFKLDLSEDGELVAAISALTKKGGGEGAPVIAVSGSNAMTRCLTLLAAQLGYRGRFVQVAAPDFAQEQTQHEGLEKGKQDVRKWEDVIGRVVTEGTAHEAGKFTLAVVKPGGGKVMLGDVDVVINAAGKTASTALIEAMKARGYVETLPEALPGESGLLASHEMLEGQHGFFSLPDQVEGDDDAPSITLAPSSGRYRSIEPIGWESAYEFGLSIRSQGDASA